MAGTARTHGRINLYKGVVMPPMCTPESIDKAIDLDLQQGDTLIANYPKTGTMWIGELAWLLTHGADTELANKELPIQKAQPIEMKLRDTCGADNVSGQPRPWLAVTHLPANVLTKQINSDATILLLIRNPKDTLVSLYHFLKCIPVFQFGGTWDEFFQMFKDKELFGGDFFEWYESWLPYLDRPNIKLVTYEDMKDDLRSVMMDVASVLDVAPSGADIEKMLAHLTLDAMKANKGKTTDEQNTKPAAGSYYRKGQVGDWKNYFSEEQQIYVDQRYAQSALKNVIALKSESKN